MQAKWTTTTSDPFVISKLVWPNRIPTCISQNIPVLANGILHPVAQAKSESILMLLCLSSISSQFISKFCSFAIKVSNPTIPHHFHCYYPSLSHSIFNISGKLVSLLTSSFILNLFITGVRPYTICSRLPLWPHSHIFSGYSNHMGLLQSHECAMFKAFVFAIPLWSIWEVQNDTRTLGSQRVYGINSSQTVREHWTISVFAPFPSYFLIRLLIWEG